ncbi:sensor histidine kinase [Novosphingobium sp.]|uniref:sensor histidine kinase n=1 Tax=Novosphingobium sp. TaxID=1874826 RepID=UPI0038B85416
MLLAIALALLVAQSLSAVLIWREQSERHFFVLVNNAAFRLMGDQMRQPGGPEFGGPHRHGPDGREGRGPDAPSASPGAPHGPPPPPDDLFRLPRPLRLQTEATSPQRPGDKSRPDVLKALRELLETQGVTPGPLLVVQRDPHADPLVEPWLRDLRKRLAPIGWDGDPQLIVAAMRRADGSWLTARLIVPPTERQQLLSLLPQTVLLYLLLVGAVALILRRLARPLRALTRRVEDFARDRRLDGQLEPEGPEDIQRLVMAHNLMENRIAALLDEKDVMLGAIGHDLKTPLAALRVRIEAVEDDVERGRMAATIEDINRSLDDILSLARVGRPSDPLEPTELSALVADVVGEYEDMGEPVTLEEGARMVASIRATWLRRALRNLISNALRYGEQARVTLVRQGREAVLTVADDGPGIPERDIERMMEPFTRMEASRNSTTGGTGLGLTLARAIADQHGGSLHLANRVEGARIRGLIATLRVPLVNVDKGQP